MTTRERHNSYAALSTMLALVIVVVYANENYSEWDAVIGVVGLMFSLSFLKRVEDADVLENGLAAFLAGVSLSICVIAIFSFLGFGALKIPVWMDDNLLNCSIGLAIGFAALRYAIYAKR